LENRWAYDKTTEFGSEDPADPSHPRAHHHARGGLLNLSLPYRFTAVRLCYESDAGAADAGRPALKSGSRLFAFDIGLLILSELRILQRSEADADFLTTRTQKKFPPPPASRKKAGASGR
jgi:hypothetical protein